MRSCSKDIVKRKVISAKHDTVEGFQPIVKSLYPLLFLYYKISFVKSIPGEKSALEEILLVIISV